jgi:hypothetical protein
VIPSIFNPQLSPGKLYIPELAQAVEEREDRRLDLPEGMEVATLTEQKPILLKPERVGQSISTPNREYLSPAQSHLHRLDGQRQ